MSDRTVTTQALIVRPTKTDDLARGEVASWSIYLLEDTYLLLPNGRPDALIESNESIYAGPFGSVEQAQVERRTSSY